MCTENNNQKQPLTQEQINKLLEVLKIRFDTSPRLYSKEDFHLLIKVLSHIAGNTIYSDDLTNALDYITDEEIDASFDEQEKLVQNKYNKIQ